MASHSKDVLATAAAEAEIFEMPSSSPTQHLVLFTVPPVYDAVFYNKPDAHSVLVHACGSSSVEWGFQAIICFHSRPILPSHLGLPPMSSYEDRVFLQVASENKPFIRQCEALSSQAMQINVTEYLILLQFVANEWSRLQSKLNSQLATMREGTDPVYITSHLLFYNHGSSHYRVSLSSRLVLKAWIDSRDTKPLVRVCLEKKWTSIATAAAATTMEIAKKCNWPWKV